MADDQPKNVKDTNDKIGFGMIVTAVILVGLAVFVIQNLDSTPVEFLFFSASLPLWLVVVVSVALGVVLGWIWRWMSRRRKKD
ncbi:MAG: lipopolysaccharide assembly protein LapA domain-containing protein [Actinomycetota bacterium]|nr:lipopolysaccharide assembly protein LapA domain-containing protein [Actinomycetota bacterium]